MHKAVSRGCLDFAYKPAMCSRSKLDLDEGGEGGLTVREKKGRLSKRKEEEVPGKKKRSRGKERTEEEIIGTRVAEPSTNRVTRRKYDSRRNSCHWRSARQRTRRTMTFRR